MCSNELCHEIIKGEGKMYSNELCHEIMKRIEMEMFNESISMFMKRMNSKVVCSCTPSLPYDNSSELYVKALTCVVDGA